MKCAIEKASWSCDNHTWKGEHSDPNTAPCKEAYKGDDGRWYVDITSMDQLKDLIKEVNEEIIVSVNESDVVGNDYLCIRVYDQYIE
nr:MAG TPA: hypothetical protein [Caudoviricetes sp.]